MEGHTFLINLMGAIALLIWSIRMVKTGVLRAFGEKFRHAIAGATSNRIKACFTGAAVATAVQSSAATGLIVASFAERGLITLGPALAVMLGADIGSTLVVQALAFNLGQLMPLLLIAGVCLFMLTDKPVPKQVGRIIIGLALMIMALGMIKGAADPLKQSELLKLVMQRLASDPVMGIVLGALIAWLMHSSVAAILLVLSLAASDVIGLPPAIALVLGCNIGSALIPLGLSAQTSIAAKRILIGNLAFRTAGAVLALILLPLIVDLSRLLASDTARQLANLHTLFNVAVAVIFLPLTGLAVRVLEASYPDETASKDKPIAHLDDALLDRPQVALAAAGREVMRMADQVEVMLRETILAFSEDSDARRQSIKLRDNEVDRLQEDVKLYLTRLTRQPLSETDSRKAFDLILFTTNLEHVGDIIDKSLLELAAKKHRLNVEFSPAGWSEIQSLHTRVVEQMRLAVAVFMTGDMGMARELVTEKDRIRVAEREAMESHLSRLREGTLASIETSTLHLDILRDLKRINAHITSVAYSSLEASGFLRGSRLKSAAV
ncbi:MAG: Na/Pi cotransporter family protein [Beijerinckiaceae bacterium]